MGQQTINRSFVDELNYRLSTVANTGAPFGFLGLALSHLPTDAHFAVLYCLIGLAGYTLAEYGFHRWILHYFRIPGHLRHHSHPVEPEALPFSAGFTAHVALLFILTLTFGLAAATWIVAGSSAGYAFFCHVHDIEHREAWLAQRLWPKLHRHHMLHHHTDRPPTGAPADGGCNYGVVTTAWDRLFGTFRG